jgi:cytochrome c peroxidase
MINPVEMASPKAHVSEQLAAIPGNATAFKAAFPGTGPPKRLTMSLHSSEVSLATSRSWNIRY